MMEFWGYLAELVTRSDKRNIDFVTGCHQAPVALPPTNGYETLLRKTLLQQKGGGSGLGWSRRGEGRGLFTASVAVVKLFQNGKKAPDQFSPFSPLPRRYWVRVSPQPFPCLLRFSL